MWGDETKGSTVDFLTRKYNAGWNIRFQGGAQAGHNIITSNGIHHTFSQFGSGTLAGSHTFLSKYMIIDPTALKNEAIALVRKGIYNPFGRLYVSEDALIVTPYQKFLNQAKEFVRNNNKHGSCGMGIGETMSDSLKGIKITAKDLKNETLLRDKLKYVLQIKYDELYKLNCDTPEYTYLFESNLVFESIINDYLFIGKNLNIVWEDHITKILQNPGAIIFEGAQGVLLDQDFGAAPYNSWSNCTYDNANALLGDYDGKITRLGLIRGFQTKHGAGPFPTEEKSLQSLVKNDHNQTNHWQGNFRTGWLDLILLDYAQRITKNQMDYLCVSHLDLIQDLKQYYVANKYLIYGNLAYGKDKIVKQINPFPPINGSQFEGSKEFTKLLENCCPCYEQINPKDLSAKLQSIGYKIGIESYGPTSKDKICYLNE